MTEETDVLACGLRVGDCISWGVSEHVHRVRDKAFLKKTWEIKEGGTFLPLWRCWHNALSEHCN